MRVLARIGGVGAAVLALGAVPGAQTPPATFSASSELVVLRVSVTDRQGRPVTDLDPAAFRVTVDGQPRPIRFAGRDEGPVTVGLVVDGSGSMWPLRGAVVEAVGAFASASRPDDELFGLVFHDGVESVLPGHAPFTADAGVLRSAFDRHLQARGRTALYDAVQRGLVYAARGTRERKVLVIVSDGGDNASTGRLADIAPRAQESGVAIHAVALEDDRAARRDRSGGRAVLEALASRTGGTVVPPVSRSRLVDGLRRIARQIRSGYVLGFVPTPDGLEGGFHRVHVGLAGPGRDDLRVFSRAGYWAGARAAH